MEIMDDTVYFGWMRVIAAARTAAELAVLERRLQMFAASAERDQLTAPCGARRLGLGEPMGSAALLA